MRRSIRARRRGDRGAVDRGARATAGRGVRRRESPSVGTSIASRSIERARGGGDARAISRICRAKSCARSRARAARGWRAAGEVGMKSPTRRVSRARSGCARDDGDDAGTVTANETTDENARLFHDDSKTKKQVKNGQPSFYPADDIKKPLKRTIEHKQTKLRASIAPGQVLILLAGHFKGKRVVFLKQLESGLLLVAGPYGVNGVPAKRVNQRYVIATSEKVDVSGAAAAAAKFTDASFKKPAKDRSNKKSEEEFFKVDLAKKELPADYLENNKALDKALGDAIAKTPYLKEYMSTLFTLKSGDKPHEMKF